jgi:hypothetical protein
VLLGVLGAGEYLDQLGAAIEQLPDLRQVDLLGLDFLSRAMAALAGRLVASGRRWVLASGRAHQGRDVRPGELAARLPCGARAGRTAWVVRTAQARDAGPGWW